jgi:hypothetical protein
MEVATRKRSTTLLAQPDKGVWPSFWSFGSREINAPGSPREFSQSSGAGTTRGNGYEADLTRVVGQQQLYTKPS